MNDSICKFNPECKFLHWKSYAVFYFALLWLFLMGMENSALTQTAPTIRIMAYQSNDSLKVKYEFRNLFRGETRKALLAGLPLIFKINYQLQNGEGKEILRGERTLRISYNVWEELFSIQPSRMKKLTFESIDELEQNLSRFNKFTLGLAAAFSDAEFYRINSQVHLMLLSRDQERQLKWWLQNSEETEEELPSRERATGFKLNLNKLIQAFVSRKTQPREFVFSASSSEFKIKQLPLYEPNSH